MGHATRREGELAACVARYCRQYVFRPAHHGNGTRARDGHTAGARALRMLWRDANRKGARGARTGLVDPLVGAHTRARRDHACLLDLVRRFISEADPAACGRLGAGHPSLTPSCAVLLSHPRRGPIWQSIALWMDARVRRRAADSGIRSFSWRTGDSWALACVRACVRACVSRDETRGSRFRRVWQEGRSVGTSIDRARLHPRQVSPLAR